MNPARNETHIRAHVLARLPILCAERLRGAVVLLAAFESADNDHVTRGYVAWQRADECGTHAFTFHLREVGGTLTIGNGGSDAELHSGNYNLSTRGALMDASDRLSASYIADEQRRAYGRRRATTEPHDETGARESDDDDAMTTSRPGGPLVDLRELIYDHEDEFPEGAIDALNEVIGWK